jgi:hypothetical protein
MIGFGASGGCKKTTVFNPAVMSLKGWWRGSYTGSPWAGTVSIGSSALRDLTEATNPPTPGVVGGEPVNGFAPAIFDGANDQLGNVSATSTFITASAYLWWALFYATANGGTSSGIGNAYTNPCLFANTSAFIGSSIFYNGSNNLIQVWHYDTDWRGNEHQISLNAWNLICCRFDGSNIRSSLNSGAVTATAAGNVGDLSNPIAVGRNYDGSARFTGRLLELGFIDSAQTDARFTDIKSYVNSRYALSL